MRAVVALALAMPAVAAAQVGVHLPGDFACQEAFPCEGEAVCFEIFGDGAACRPVPTEEGAIDVCVPDGAAFCCTDGLIVCPGELECHRDDGAETGLCVDRDLEYCDESDPAQVLLCHTDTIGRFPVAYERGDCDRDGVTNAGEERADTDPCERPPSPIGVWIVADGEITCRVGVTACESVGGACRNETVDEVCQRDERTGDDAPLCAPAADLFCCGGAADAVCPALDCVSASDRPDAPGVCTNEDLVCGDTEVALRACHTSPAGVIPVPIERGDCDEDGVVNVEDETPCGGARDAGSVVEPPRTIEPRFNGGGGCVCGASSRAGGRPWGLLAIVALALRRRVRRAARRRGEPSAQRHEWP